jgi:hypothetical protein
MKLVCDCGKERELNYPLEFLEITRFVLGHGHESPPRAIEAKCVCGATRLIGPGAAPVSTPQRDLFKQGLSDGAWLESHAACKAV